MKIVKEHLYEKFKEDSDPIRDMGIGDAIYNLKNTFKQMFKLDKIHNHNYFLEFINVNSTTEQIEFRVRLMDWNVSSAMAERYIKNLIKDVKLDKYLEYRSNVFYKGSSANLYYDVKEPYMEFFMPFSQHRMYEDNFNLSESFSEHDSDPVDDMGIGIRNVILKRLQQIYDTNQEEEGEIMLHEIIIRKYAIIFFMSGMSDDLLFHYLYTTIKNVNLDECLDIAKNKVSSKGSQVRIEIPFKTEYLNVFNEVVDTLEKEYYIP